MKCCDLTDKVAIITGASRGIGEAIATQLSICGANIILTARNAENLNTVKKFIKKKKILKLFKQILQNLIFFNIMLIAIFLTTLSKKIWNLLNVWKK